LKVMPTNPTFLDGRNAILRALDDLLTVGRIPADLHRRVKAAIWQAFAAFGMGVNASSVDADVAGSLPTTTYPLTMSHDPNRRNRGVRRPWGRIRAF
jgi:extracellular elastinolytic metalloproteinase